MAKQSSDESESESEPEVKDRAGSREEPSVSHESPAHGSETEEQSEIKPDGEEKTEASVYTEQDLTEEGTVKRHKIKFPKAITSISLIMYINYWIFFLQLIN